MHMPWTNPPAKQAQGSRASGWLSTIRARLYLAFGFAAALTIVGASVAFYEFTIIGSTTNEIVSRSLPTTAVSLRLAEQASSLVSSGPRLMTAGTEKVRTDILAEINGPERMRPGRALELRREVDVVDRDRPEPGADDHAEDQEAEDEARRHGQPVALEAPPCLASRRNRDRVGGRRHGRFS